MRNQQTGMKLMIQTIYTNKSHSQMQPLKKNTTFFKLVTSDNATQSYSFSCKRVSVNQTFKQ